MGRWTLITLLAVGLLGCGDDDGAAAGALDATTPGLAADAGQAAPSADSGLAAGDGGSATDDAGSPTDPLPDASAADSGAPDTGGKQGLPPIPGGDLAATGPFDVTSTSKGGPGGKFTLAHPKELGKDGLLHPIITWGNGTGAPTIVYGALLAHLASHGFVVIATNSVMTGNGKQMLAGVEWLIQENSRPGSVFHQRLATSAVGATGHSQGGGGAIAAGNDPRVTCTAPLEPSPSSVSGLKGPMFVVAGGNDSLISPTMVESQVYNPSPVPTVFGVLAGATHFTPVGDGGPMRGYLTAWFRLQLMGDESLRDVFYGPGCGICVDGEWTIKRKNM